MNEHGRNETDIFRCLDVEYTPEGHSEVYRWDDFLKIAGGHVHSAMYLIDMVSAGGEYEGEEHFCWCETVAPDFSRARGHFPDTIVAAWAAARSANQSDGNLGIKERML